MGDALNFPPTNNHPATFSKELVEPLVDALSGGLTVLDPFAGTGRIHEIAKFAGVPYSIGIELEEEWANVDLYYDDFRRQYIGDARVWIPNLARRYAFDRICTSPAYANRMADHHDAQERCKACGGVYPLIDGCVKCDGKGFREYKRNTYKHRLGRDLTPGNSGAMQWTGRGGEDYRELHEHVWRLCAHYMTEDGKFVLNCKDHYRGNVLQRVTDWHVETLEGLGLETERIVQVPVKGNRQGANREKRQEYEFVITMTKKAEA